MPKGVYPRERKVPLRTGDKREAIVRLSEVERVEDLLKQGEEWEFPWLNDTAVTRPRTYALSEAIQDYLDFKRADGIRPKTLISYTSCLNRTALVLGGNFELSRFNIETIDLLKKRWRDELSPTTININLRSVKAFLNWLHERGKINSVPRIKPVAGEKQDPQYISNADFDAICKATTPHCVRVFEFYRQTGLRLSEPFHATLNGNYLTIEAEYAKGRRSRDIYLTYDLIEIFGIIHKKGYQPGYYSREFHKAAKQAGVIGRKFHSLRHTAALRLYLRTKDIHEVFRQLGHANLNTTLIYMRYDPKKLMTDFPDLVNAEGPRGVHLGVVENSAGAAVGYGGQATKW
jgi:integrase